MSNHKRARRRAGAEGNTGGREMRRGALCVGATAVLVLFLAAGGLAATSPIVPAGGKVAGKGYAYYLKRVWLLNFAGSPP